MARLPKVTDRSSLADLIHLEEVEPPRLYRGDVHTNLQRAFGGQVMAESLLAAYPGVPDERLAHSLHAYFLRPGDPAVPVFYDVETTREGKTFSTRRVVARQAGNNIFQNSVSFKLPERALEHGDPVPPGVPAPDDCPPLAELLRGTDDRLEIAFEHEFRAVEVRYAGDSSVRGGIKALSHGAHMRVWARVRSELPEKLRWHQAALAYLSDLTLLSVSIVPHHDVSRTQVQFASVDHTMWFHRPVRADEWILHDQVSPAASMGLGLSFGRLYQDDVLVASVAQEGLIRIGR